MRVTLLLAMCGAMILPLAGNAADPPPFPDFTFKREKPPKPGTRKLITVQIEPQPVQPAKPKAEPEKPEDSGKAAPIGAYSWFWNDVTPGIEADGTARLRQALGNLSGGPGGASVKGPRLQTVRAIANEEGANILSATIGTNVSPALVLAVIAVESGGRRAAVSGKGAQGLMQLMPATAERFGVKDSLSAEQNIKGGVAYLDWLLKEFEGDAVLALAGYNAGENAVKSHKGVPPYAETRDYVPKVLAAYQVARALCKTQPELVTDACALNLASN